MNSMHDCAMICKLFFSFDYATCAKLKAMEPNLSLVIQSIYYFRFLIKF